LNTKLHALCDNLGRPVRLHLTEGQRSDFKGADVLLKGLPKAKTLIADRGYDSNKIRKMLDEQEITPCIPPKKIAKKQSFIAKPHTKLDTRSRTSSRNSKTGGVSQLATTDAHIPSGPQSISLQQLSFGYES